MNETSKIYKNTVLFERVLRGNGIDIGCGGDVLKVRQGKVTPYDIIYDKNADAQTLPGIKNNQFDFVYSSHCLEHLEDPHMALSRWIDVCKPGGYIFVAVPDESLYEKNSWPSQFAKGWHKYSFTPFRESWLPRNISVLAMCETMEPIYGHKVTILSIGVNDTGYDYELPDTVDQTKTGACCQIEFILRKDDK